MWTASTGQQVDGVMAIDVVGVQQLLEATGPVAVRRSDRHRRQRRAVSLLHDQYAGSER